MTRRFELRSVYRSCADQKEVQTTKLVQVAPNVLLCAHSKLSHFLLKNKPSRCCLSSPSYSRVHSRFCAHCTGLRHDSFKRKKGGSSPRFILFYYLLLHKRIIELSFIVSLASNEVTKTTINTTFAISGAEKISRQQCGRWWSSHIILSPKD